MSAAQPGELREAIIGELIGQPIVRKFCTVPITPRDAHLLADALLPVVTAYAERLARERAAEELESAAAVRWADKIAWAEVRLDLRRRAAALTADDQSVQP